MRLFFPILFVSSLAWENPRWQPHESVRVDPSPRSSFPSGDSSPPSFSSYPSNSVEHSLSNFPPVLQVSSSVGYIDESADIGTTVRVSPHSHSESLQILVSDADLKAGMPPATYQYVLTGLGATIFAVDQRGFVYLNVNAIDGDPPNPASYDLQVQAREVDTMPIRSSAPVSITIHVVDINDNPPLFEHPVYTASTPATGGPRSVLMVEATDRDEGMYGTVRHEIVQVDGSEDTSDFFYDDNSKSLIARGNLTPGKAYQVRLQATDGGGLSAQTVVVVNALAPMSSHHSPTTQPPSSEEETIETIVTEIRENTPLNTLVVKLADDSTAASRPFRVVYSIDGGNDERRFDIEPNTGSIRTVSTFDREVTTSYSLLVDARAVETNQHLYWTIVQVTITDVNDNAPIFVGAQPIRIDYEVSEVADMRRNAKLGRVKVSDADMNENGRLTLGVLSPYDRLFEIAKDGSISINGDFTAEHLGQHRVMIFARDHGDPPRESLASLIVNIKAAPDVEIVAETPPPSSTSTLPATTTTITTTTTTTRKPKESGLLSMLSSLGVGPTSTIPSSTTEGRLAPVFNPPTVTVSIDENRMDVEIAKMAAAYPDGGGGSLSFVLVEGDEDTFKVDSYTGSVRLIRPLDAESEKSLSLTVSTREASSLLINPVLAHNATVTIVVGDTNDWIPAFESSEYSFSVRADTQPGTIIGQVTAFDEDRDAPNNVLHYSILGGGEGIFSVNPDSGLISLAKSLDGLAGQQIRLKIEASDGGETKQSAVTTVIISIEEEGTVIPEAKGVTAPPPTSIRFSQRNFSASVSESVRPPHLVLVLPVENKPPEYRLISCSIASGNYRGAFGVTSNNGNCELRTQMELDRESIERHLLNITVSSSSGQDSALVSVSVTDSNDNSPRFVYENDLSLSEYFAGVSSDAGAFTRIATVKATDADVGNSSVVRYSLDALSLHSKYFSISPNGEISTRQSMPQLLHASKMDKFELKVLACDSPTVGQQLCSKADVTVVVVTDDNRIRMATSGMQPAQLRTHEIDMIRTLRASTGRCSLLTLEKMAEMPSGVDGRPRTNVTWFAIDPATRKICSKDDLSSLFAPSAVAMAAGKLRPWFTLESLAPEFDERRAEGHQESSLEWRGASSALVIVSIIVALGALLAVCALCFFYARYKVKEEGREKGNGEVEMLEMPMSEEDSLTLKGRRHTSQESRESRERERVSYRNYGREVVTNYEGDFSIEESMYALNVPGRIDPHSKRNSSGYESKEIASRR